VTTAGSPSACPGPYIRWRGLARQAIVGFLFGYVVLHPASMVIFQWLDPRISAAVHDSNAGK